MKEQKETITLSDREMEVFIAHPDGPAHPLPVLVQLMDGLGMREELRDHARRAASWGYYVLAPDLFHRFGLKGPLDISDPAQKTVILEAIGALSSELATADVEAALKLAEVDPVARKGPIGLYGFCMGGKLTLQLAQSLGARVAAGAAIHPGNLATEASDSPHRHLDHVRAELYFGIADEDATATPEQIGELDQALEAQGIAFQVEWHPGALHGFMMPSRPGTYHREAAEKAWDRIKALFARRLP